MANRFPPKTNPDPDKRKAQCCDEWEPQMDYLNEAVAHLFHATGGQWKYEGIPFRFCPWCGRKRTNA